MCYHNRYCDAQQGRFISRDYIGEGGVENCHAYCQIKPLAQIDSFGLWITNVHNDRMAEWVLDLNITEKAASEFIVKSDDQIDTSNDPTQIKEP